MPEAARTRRTFLADFGRVTVAAVVLGACATDDTASSATSGRSSSGTSSSDSSSTVPSTVDATSTSSSAGSNERSARWSRIDLGFVSAYAIVAGGEAMLIDTGTDGSGGAIEAALAEMGTGWDALSTVIVTHAHPDHVGSVAAVMDAAPAATVFAGEADIPSIQAGDEVTAAADGDVVAGLQIVATPGHTPGHLSVYHPGLRWLAAGDALNGEGGSIAGPNPQFTADMPTAIDSVRRLVGLDFDTIVFGHGDPVTGGAGEALAELVETL